ncbi:lactosylceramide 4-alpha-galactosyltransferase-like [Macrobrachium nipponense]|uniref:lactosylceramide 4-alpha-galactosyltransferase-like n=1 Tax=Macrobrachium nipponense TaxID=159736 RepID=UPI0030C85D79
MTSPVADQSDDLVPSLTRIYKNLRVVKVDLKTVFSDTPLEDIYAAGLWRKNNTWPEINLADIMRLAVVWKMGGLYADSDVVCIRQVTHLTNMIAWQEGFTLGSGVFHFSRHHPVLKLVMEYIRENFQPEKWGSSGPIVFTRILKDLCDVKDKKKKCLGVSLLPIRSFYPIPSVIWKTLFMPQDPRPIRKRYPSSYMIHFWNQLSYDEPIVKGSGSIYDQAATTFCPNTRRIATKQSSGY